MVAWHLKLLLWLKPRSLNRAAVVGLEHGCSVFGMNISHMNLHGC